MTVRGSSTPTKNPADGISSATAALVSIAPVTYRNHCPHPIASNSATIVGAAVSLDPPAIRNIAARPTCTTHRAMVAPRRLWTVSALVVARVAVLFVITSGSRLVHECTAVASRSTATSSARLTHRKTHKRRQRPVFTGANVQAAATHWRDGNQRAAFGCA